MNHRLSAPALVLVALLAACSTDRAVAPTDGIKKVDGPVSHIVNGQLAPYKVAPPQFFSPVELAANGDPLGNIVAGQAKGAKKPPPPPPIKYWGGNVIRSQKLAAIYLSTTPIYAGGPAPKNFGAVPAAVGSGPTDRSLVGHFLNNLGGSSYWNINSTYYDVIGGQRNFINNTMAYESYWAVKFGTYPHSGDLVTYGDDMPTIIELGFQSGALTYDPNTLYMIFTGPGVNLGGGFSHDGLGYCAFHSGYWFADGTVVQFAAMPYDADFDPAHPYVVTGTDGIVHKYGCTNLTKGPNGDLGADATVSAMAHEIEENATDPVTIIGGDGFFASWYDELGAENGDKCAYVYGPTLRKNSLDYWNMRIGGKSFLVQQNWTNVRPQGCLTGLDPDNQTGEHNGQTPTRQ